MNTSERASRHRRERTGARGDCDLLASAQDERAKDEAARPGRLAEARGVAASTGKALALLWAVGPGRAVAWGAATALDALLPAAVALVAKQIVDAVVARSLDDTVTWVGVECVLVLTRAVLYHLDSYLRTLLGGRLSIHVNALILSKALDVAPRHFEDSDFNDRLSRAAKEAGTRPIHLVTHAFVLVREALRLASYVVVLWDFSPWVVLAILGGTAPQFATQAWAASESFRVQMARTFDERRADYLKEVLLREAFVKEIKLFALGRYLLDRYREAQERFYEQDRRVVRRTLGVLFGCRLLATLTFYGCYVVVAVQAVRGRITLGDMTMLMLVVRGGQESFEAALNAAAKVYEGNLYMTNLFLFLGQPADEPWEELERAPEHLPAGEGPGEGAGAPPEVVFEEVGFAYPGTARAALEGVTLRIAPGETLALVGRNGAGKTTLIKLLVRLYEPTAGRILLDGADVAALAPAAVRRRIGVIFQDFVQFNLTVAENVGLGWMPSIGDEAAVHRAAQQGGAAEFVERLPDRYATPLGRYFGGAQLSVGQWQRLALSRAFMRRSDLLILDEPTAALDAESEAELFERFQELKEGRTAILITHRFSTVRFADRIVVLDEGRVVEEGTHAELLAAGGLYARMFLAQAEGYQLEAGGRTRSDGGGAP
jgi:ATP-binding cassette subfamily B protein